MSFAAVANFCLLFCIIEIIYRYCRVFACILSTSLSPKTAFVFNIAMPYYQTTKMIIWILITGTLCQKDFGVTRNDWEGWICLLIELYITVFATCYYEVTSTHIMSMNIYIYTCECTVNKLWCLNRIVVHLLHVIMIIIDVIVNRLTLSANQLRVA